MNGEEIVLLKSVLDVISSFGVIGVLGLLIILLYRGDLLPRKVWEELTRNTMKELCREFKDMLNEVLARQNTGQE